MWREKQQQLTLIRFLIRTVAALSNCSKSVGSLSVLRKIALSYGMSSDAFKIAVKAFPFSVVWADSRMLDNPVSNVLVFLNENIPPTPNLLLLFWYNYLYLYLIIQNIVK